MIPYREVLWPKYETLCDVIDLSRVDPILGWVLQTRALLRLAEEKNIEVIAQPRRGLEDIARRYGEVRATASRALAEMYPLLYTDEEFIKVITHLNGGIALTDDLEIAKTLQKKCDGDSIIPAILTMWGRKLYSFDPDAWEFISKQQMAFKWEDAAHFLDDFPGGTVIVELPPVEAGYRNSILGQSFYLGGTVMRPTPTAPPLMVLMTLGAPQDVLDPRVASTAITLFAREGEQDNTPLEQWNGHSGAQVAAMFMSVVSYLRYRPDDYVAKSSPLTPKERRKARKYGITGPQRLLAGTVMGRAIRLCKANVEAAEEYNLTAPSGRKRPVPHWRKPHSRPTWVGVAEERRLEVRWIDACIVNASLGEPHVVKHAVHK